MFVQNGGEQIQNNNKNNAENNQNFGLTKNFDSFIFGPFSVCPVCHW